MNNYHTFNDAFSIIIGLVLVIFSKKIAKSTHNFYFKLYKVHFLSEKVYQLASFFMGLLFIIDGLLELLQII